MNQKPPVDEPFDSLEELAAAWLEAERAMQRREASRRGLEAKARHLSALYDDAIRAASQEDLRLAWEGARKIQSGSEMGSRSWAEARDVSELLRREYQARG